MAGRPPGLKHGEAFVASGSKKKCEHAIDQLKRTSDVLLDEESVQKKLKLRTNKRRREREPIKKCIIETAPTNTP